jgi:2'-hydroxyisoflavone reductase
MSNEPRNRRRFVLDALAATAALSLPLHRLAAFASHDATRTVAPKKILILGGTGFIGPHLVRRAVAHGHTVSTFTRGRRDAELPDSVERLIGDRNGKLDALMGRDWDAVIDDSATNPEWVRQSTALLADHAGRYLFTSSTGVYYPYLAKGLKESDPVHTDAGDPKDPSESYGTQKAQCEATVQRVFGARGTVVRPTYIVGPGDTSDRFTYWPVRLARGGDVLAPGRQDDPVQFIDVRDLTAFMVHLVESDASGIFNAIGPQPAMTVKTFLDLAQRAVGKNVRYHWFDDDAWFLKNEIDGVVPWILARGKDLGHTSIVSTRAFAAGLTLRPVSDTLVDTLAWFNTLPAARQAAAKWVLKPEQESALLAQLMK